MHLHVNQLVEGLHQRNHLNAPFGVNHVFQTWAIQYQAELFSTVESHNVRAGVTVPVMRSNMLAGCVGPVKHSADEASNQLPLKESGKLAYGRGLAREGGVACGRGEACGRETAVEVCEACEGCEVWVVCGRVEACRREAGCARVAVRQEVECGRGAAQGGKAYVAYRTQAVCERWVRCEKEAGDGVYSTEVLGMVARFGRGMVRGTAAACGSAVCGKGAACGKMAVCGR